MEKKASQLWKILHENQNLTHETPTISQDELDQQSNRSLKKSYAYWFIGILIGQLVVMNGVFIAHGAGCLTFDEVTLRIYTGSTVLEVFGVIVIIVHNLFPNTKKKQP